VKRLAEHLEQLAACLKTAYYSGHYPVGEGKVFVKSPTRNAANTMLVCQSGADQYTVLSMKKNKIFDVYGMAVLVKHFTMPDQLIRVAHEQAQKAGIVKYYRTFKGSDFITHMLNDEGINANTLYEWFPALKEKEVEHHKQIGGFTFITGNNVSENELENVEELVETASRLLEKVGLGDLLYGKIYVLADMGKHLANYLESDDTIRMSNKCRKSPTAVKTLIHEIGHRLYAKKLSSEAKVAIDKKFCDEIKFVSAAPKIGDVFEDKKGVTYKVITMKGSGSLYSTKLYYVMERSDKPGDQWRVNGDYFVGMKRIKGEEHDSSKWVPSQYSKKNDQEWFCEILGWGLVDNNSTYIKFIKSLL